LVNEVTQQLRLNFQIKNNEDDPNLIIVIGGDGTFLYALQRYQHALRKAL
jgi:NAD kinase